MTDIEKQNRARIADYIRSGSTPIGNHMIGLELEHIVVRRTTREAVTYAEPGGIREVLEALAPFYDSRIYEGDDLIGLVGDDANITLEPGAQLEISIAPFENISQVAEVYRLFKDRLDAILERYDYEALTLGYLPYNKASEMPLLPKKRYDLMDAHFKTTGEFGICMMRGSASTQVSIDYSDETDAIRKFKIANLLGPLIAFICDNSPVFEGEDAQGRMTRTRIWQDVDNMRSQVAPHLFDGTSYDFERYADTIMSAEPILVMQDGKTLSTKGRSADEVYADHVLTEAEIEHLLSMYFFDVRLKRYIEIRTADSMPIGYALAYAAFIKGLFYNSANLDAIESLLPSVTPESVPAAKAALMEDGYAALVYGRRAFEWFDELLALAWRGLEAEERLWLTPLCRLVENRTTLFDDAREYPDTHDETKPNDDYERHIVALGGDVEGRSGAFEYLQGSTAIYHDEVIAFSYIPKLLPVRDMRTYKHIAETTHRILNKVIGAYVENPEYRKIFGFPAQLEELICLPSGYRQELPLCRIDIFRNEDSGMPGNDTEFRFCEFNSDGTSGMNEDREVARALLDTPVVRAMQEDYEVVPQTLFDPWVRALLSLYSEFPQAIPNPYVAMLDFTEKTTPHEIEEFKRRFDRHGTAASFFDLRELTYDGISLRGNDGRRIDCVYRRAVTSDVMEHIDEIQPFIDAVRDGNVCLIGSFRTQVAHCKKVFKALRDPETLAFLSKEEVAFLAERVPYTEVLSEDFLESHDVIETKDSWIIKPCDGYAASGVYAGLDYDASAWEELVGESVNKDYVIQEYCTPYKSKNLNPVLPKDGNPLAFESLRNLTGLYVYDGTFAGVFSRAGSENIIAGFRGGRTLASFIVRRKR